VLGFVYVVSAVLGVLLLGVAGFCSANAGHNHLSAWHVGTYASLLTAFALLAQTAPLAAAAAAAH